MENEWLADSTVLAETLLGTDRSNWTPKERQTVNEAQSDYINRKPDDDERRRRAKQHRLLKRQPREG